VIAVPISAGASAHLRYASWEWKTRALAKKLAKDKDFTVGYMHLRSMSGAEGEDAFVRGLYPDYDKQGLIVDVRHNHGGNIDSWLLDALQRKAWSFWQGRASNITNGGLGWDEQFAFRGHIVILIDEKTSSDGEGFSRGVAELGLGRLVGTRTWGGGIWLSSDNHLVDGGIATAPEIGTYNNNFGWGLGIEQLGVQPDIEIDNNPRTTFDGKDEQMEAAINILKEWLEDEPYVLPNKPGPHTNMSLQKEYESCEAD
jgi:tricorn protease